MRDRDGRDLSGWATSGKMAEPPLALAIAFHAWLSQHHEGLSETSRQQLLTAAPTSEAVLGLLSIVGAALPFPPPAGPRSPVYGPDPLTLLVGDRHAAALEAGRAKSRYVPLTRVQDETSTTAAGGPVVDRLRSLGVVVAVVGDPKPSVLRTHRTVVHVNADGLRVFTLAPQAQSIQLTGVVLCFPTQTLRWPGPGMDIYNAIVLMEQINDAYRVTNGTFYQPLGPQPYMENVDSLWGRIFADAQVDRTLRKRFVVWVEQDQRTAENVQVLRHGTLLDFYRYAAPYLTAAVGGPLLGLMAASTASTKADTLSALATAFVNHLQAQLEHGADAAGWAYVPPGLSGKALVTWALRVFQHSATGTSDGTTQPLRVRWADDATAAETDDIQVPDLSPPSAEEVAAWEKPEAKSEAVTAVVDEAAQAAEVQASRVELVKAAARTSTDIHAYYQEYLSAMRSVNDPKVRAQSRQFAETRAAAAINSAIQLLDVTNRGVAGTLTKLFGAAVPPWRWTMDEGVQAWVCDADTGYVFTPYPGSTRGKLWSGDGRMDDMPAMEAKDAIVTVNQWWLAGDSDDAQKIAKMPLLEQFLMQLQLTPLATGTQRKNLERVVDYGPDWRGPAHSTLEAMVAAGHRYVEHEIDKIPTPSRAKMNAMDGDQQDAFLEKQRRAGKVTEAMLKDSTGYVVLAATEAAYVRWLTSRASRGADVPPVATGDRVAITVQGEDVVGVVEHVKKDGTITVDVSGQHSNEDVGYVDRSPSDVRRVVETQPTGGVRGGPTPVAPGTRSVQVDQIPLGGFSAVQQALGATAQRSGDKFFAVLTPDGVNGLRQALLTLGGGRIETRDEHDLVRTWTAEDGWQTGGAVKTEPAVEAATPLAGEAATPADDQSTLLPQTMDFDDERIPQEQFAPILAPEPIRSAVSPEEHTEIAALIRRAQAGDMSVIGRKGYARNMGELSAMRAFVRKMNRRLDGEEATQLKQALMWLKRRKTLTPTEAPLPPETLAFIFSRYLPGWEMREDPVALRMWPGGDKDSRTVEGHVQGHLEYAAEQALGQRRSLNHPSVISASNSRLSVPEVWFAWAPSDFPEDIATLAPKDFVGRFIQPYTGGPIDIGVLYLDGASGEPKPAQQRRFRNKTDAYYPGYDVRLQIKTAYVPFRSWTITAPDGRKATLTAPVYKAEEGPTEIQYPVTKTSWKPLYDIGFGEAVSMAIELAEVDAGALPTAKHTTNTAICPVCFGYWARVGGALNMAQHRYRRPGWGYNVSPCMGSGYPQWQDSSTGTQHAYEEYMRDARRLLDRLQDLRRDPTRHAFRLIVGVVNDKGDRVLERNPFLAARYGPYMVEVFRVEHGHPRWPKLYDIELQSVQESADSALRAAALYRHCVQLWPALHPAVPTVFNAPADVRAEVQRLLDVELVPSWRVTRTDEKGAANAEGSSPVGGHQRLAVFTRVGGGTWTLSAAGTQLDTTRRSTLEDAQRAVTPWLLGTGEWPMGDGGGGGGGGGGNGGDGTPKAADPVPLVGGPVGLLKAVDGLGRRLVGVYKTAGGLVGAEIRQSDSPRGTTYSYKGTWGAGSGHSLADMTETLRGMLGGRRGVQVVMDFHKTTAPTSLVPEGHFDASEHETVLTYAIIFLTEKKLSTPKAAAERTVESLNGVENMFISSSKVIYIDPVRLEAAIWRHIEDHAIGLLAHLKKRTYAPGMSAELFNLSKKGEADLRARVEARVGKLVDDDAITVDVESPAPETFKMNLSWDREMGEHWSGLDGPLTVAEVRLGTGGWFWTGTVKAKGVWTSPAGPFNTDTEAIAAADANFPPGWRTGIDDAVLALPDLSYANLQDGQAVDTEQPYTASGVTFDAAKGVGRIPNNQEINYRGFVLWLRPSEFLKLTPKMEQTPEKAQAWQDSLTRGVRVGPPMLRVELQNPERVFRIVGHEGRHRMEAIRVRNDAPVPVQVFPSGGRAQPFELFDFSITRLAGEQPSLLDSLGETLGPLTVWAVDRKLHKVPAAVDPRVAEMSEGGQAKVGEPVWAPTSLDRKGDPDAISGTSADGQRVATLMRDTSRRWLVRAPMGLGGREASATYVSLAAAKEGVGYWLRTGRSGTEPSWERAERQNGVQAGIGAAHDSIASATLGRDFNESVEDYYAREPAVKARVDAAKAYISAKTGFRRGVQVIVDFLAGPPDDGGDPEDDDAEVTVPEEPESSEAPRYQIPNPGVFDIERQGPKIVAANSANPDLRRVLQATSHPTITSDPNDRASLLMAMFPQFGGKPGPHQGTAMVLESPSFTAAALSDDDEDTRPTVVWDELMLLHQHVAPGLRGPRLAQKVAKSYGIPGEPPPPYTGERTRDAVLAFYGEEGLIDVFTRLFWSKGMYPDATRVLQSASRPSESAAATLSRNPERFVLGVQYRWPGFVTAFHFLMGLDAKTAPKGLSDMVEAFCQQQGAAEQRKAEQRAKADADNARQDAEREAAWRRTVIPAGLAWETLPPEWAAYLAATPRAFLREVHLKSLFSLENRTLRGYAPARTTSAPPPTAMEGVIGLFRQGLPANIHEWSQGPVKRYDVQVGTTKVAGDVGIGLAQFLHWLTEHPEVIQVTSAPPQSTRGPKVQFASVLEEFLASASSPDKAQKALLEPIRHDGVVQPTHKMIEGLVDMGWRLASRETWRVPDMTKIQINRATWAQEQEHERRQKAAGKKTVWSLGTEARGIQLRNASEVAYAQFLVAKSVRVDTSSTILEWSGGDEEESGWTGEDTIGGGLTVASVKHAAEGEATGSLGAFAEIVTGGPVGRRSPAMPTTPAPAETTTTIHPLWRLPPAQALARFFDYPVDLSALPAALWPTQDRAGMFTGRVQDLPTLQTVLGVFGHTPNHELAIQILDAFGLSSRTVPVDFFTEGYHTVVLGMCRELQQKDHTSNMRAGVWTQWAPYAALGLLGAKGAAADALYRTFLIEPGVGKLVWSREAVRAAFHLRRVLITRLGAATPPPSTKLFQELLLDGTPATPCPFRSNAHRQTLIAEAADARTAATRERIVAKALADYPALIEDGRVAKLADGMQWWFKKKSVIAVPMSPDVFSRLIAKLYDAAPGLDHLEQVFTTASGSAGWAGEPFDRLLDSLSLRLARPDMVERYPDYLRKLPGAPA